MEDVLIDSMSLKRKALLRLNRSAPGVKSSSNLNMVLMTSWPCFDLPFFGILLHHCSSLQFCFLFLVCAALSWIRSQISPA
jgi:hypothetical protein